MSTPSTTPLTRHAIASVDHGPTPRFRLRARSRPTHLPISMTRSRRNSMLRMRCSTVLVGTRYSAHRLDTYCTIPGPVVGYVVGGGGGGGGVVEVGSAIVPVHGTPVLAWPPAYPGSQYIARSAANEIELVVSKKAANCLPRSSGNCEAGIVKRD